MAVLEVPSDIDEEDFVFLTRYLELMKDAFVSKPKQKNITLGPALWSVLDTDIPVIVARYAENKDGKDYVLIQGSSAEIPLDEIRYES